MKTVSNIVSSLKKDLYNYTCNADVQASRNIAEVGLNASLQERPDTAPDNAGTELESSV